MEWNQRSQVSLWVAWGPPDQPPHLKPNVSLSDIAGYATKQWGGLERSLHAPRLKLFVAHATAALEAKASLNISDYLSDYGLLAVDWENARWDPAELPATPVGNVSAISADLQRKYAAYGTGPWVECPHL